LLSSRLQGTRLLSSDKKKKSVSAKKKKKLRGNASEMRRRS